MWLDSTFLCKEHVGLRQLGFFTVHGPCRRQYCGEQMTAQTVACRWVRDWAPTVDGGSTRSSRARAPRPCGHRPARTPYRPQSMPSAQKLTAGESEEARFRWCLCPRMRFGLDGEKRGVLVKLTVSARGRRIEVPSRSSPVTSLVRFFHQFLAQTLPCQRLLRPALVSRFQVEGMLLDVLDDVVLLHLALEAP